MTTKKLSIFGNNFEIISETEIDDEIKTSEKPDEMIIHEKTEEEMLAEQNFRNYLQENF